jgi:adenylate kinase family enzyme
MSNAVLILGESGSGKSTSLRNLDPKETFIVNVIGKPLPFRGAMKNYTALSSDGISGNYHTTDDTSAIKRVTSLINNKRLDIKTLVIDDFGYTITNSFMRKANQRGYERFIDIAKDMFDVLDIVSNLRDDLYCFIMMHTETDNQGRSKPKTVGKMIDQYICIEGKFTTVLHAMVIDGVYKFLTNNDGQNMSKTAMGMFEQLYIDNDLQMVKEKMNSYFNEDSN